MKSFHTIALVFLLILSACACRSNIQREEPPDDLITRPMEPLIQVDSEENEESNSQENEDQEESILENPSVPVDPANENELETP